MDAVKISARNDTSDSIKFGVDSSGNYGYIKAGADTVTPFKSQADVDAAYDSGHTNGYTNGYNSGKADARLVLISQTSFGNYETKTINISSGILIWKGDVKKYDCFMKSKSSVSHLIDAYGKGYSESGNPISLRSATDTTVTFMGRYGTISAYQIQ